MSRVFLLGFFFGGQEPLEEEFGGMFWVFSLEFFLGGYEPLREELGGKCFIYPFGPYIGSKLYNLIDCLRFNSKEVFFGVISFFGVWS